MKYSPKDMITAIKDGNVELVRLIISAEPELLHLNTPLGSWLHIATEKGQTEIVELLLELGMDVNVQGGPSKNMPINVAAYLGNLGLVNLFLDKNVVFDVSEPDRNPLFAAIHGGHIDVAAVLLNAGIDANVRYSGATMRNMGAAEFALEWGQIEIAEMIKKLNDKTMLSLAPLRSI